MRSSVLLFLLFNWISCLFAQSTDSLIQVYHSKNKNNEDKLNALDVLAWDIYLYYKPDSSLYYAQLQLDMAKKSGHKKHVSNALNTLGIGSFINGDFDKAIEYFNNCLKVQFELDDKSGAASTYNNLGVIYTNQGNHVSAIDFYSKSLKIREEINDKMGVGASYGNIGLIYHDIGENEKALEYMLKSKSIAEEVDDVYGIALMCSNLANIFSDKKEYTTALELLEKSLVLYREMNDKKEESTVLHNIGTIYKELAKYDLALDFYLQSLQIRNQLNYKQGIASTYFNLGDIYYKKNDFSKALGYGQKSFQVANEIGSLLHINESSQLLYFLNKATGNFKVALEMHEKYIQSRDSLMSEDNQKAIIHQEYKYNYEKKAVADSVNMAKEKEIKNAEIAQQKAELNAKRNQQFLLFGGLGLTLVFAIFMYNRFKITQRQRDVISQQKKVVEEQKHMVEEKNKEISDSINYAKRIQEAILPSRYSLVENLKNGFILFKPKDVVSGDFYWLERHQDAVYFAAADCTGHGVPGAMVSVVCSNALSKALLEEGITETGKLLDRTRELVIERFAKSDEEVKDGMDISLCKLSSRTLEWSGANNPLWLIKKDAVEIEEVKPDKQPIGNYAEPKPFTTHTIQLSEGDVLYIFTDGFADQFGGPKGKKFMYKPFKELLLTLQHQSMDEQKEIINQRFDEWRGAHEQVDDVCIIGVRV
jgi:serine phosphatase RsbU (regulator of sigma subunit)